MISYLDLGCHNGETVADFFEGEFGYSPQGITESIAFDPNENYKKEWQEITRKYGTVFRNEAVMNFNGEIEFSERDDDVKSSVMKDKQRFNTGKIRMVKCIDLSDFLHKFDQVVIRMDIEGAEYPVLQRMLDEGTIDKVKYIEVEFHASKMNGGWQKVEASIIKQLRLRSINFKEIKR